MRNPFILRMLAIILAISLWMGLLTGCAAEPSEAEPEVVEETTLESGITVSGSVVYAANKSIDLSQKNENIRSIVSCRWLEQNKVAVQCRISGGGNQVLYFLVYDLVRDLYVYEQYGSQFIWQNDDLDTLVYVRDYSEAGEPSQVKNKKDMVLYESSADEQICSIAFVPKGIKVELTDLRGNHSRQVIVEAAI